MLIFFPFPWISFSYFTEEKSEGEKILGSISLEMEMSGRLFLDGFASCISARETDDLHRDSAFLGRVIDAAIDFLHGL